MEIELNTSGLLRRPYLHDGYLRGVRVGEEQSIILDVVDSQGEAYRIDLIDVDQFLCNSFKDGNIINVVFLITRIPPPRDLLLDLLGELPPTVGEPDQSNHKKWVDSVERRIVTGELTFLHLEPSYGATVLALAKRITILPVDAAA